MTKFIEDFIDDSKYHKTKLIAVLIIWLLVGMLEKI